jgi:hypothetical protein
MLKCSTVQLFKTLKDSILTLQKEANELLAIFAASITTEKNESTNRIENHNPKSSIVNLKSSIRNIYYDLQQ